MNRKGWKMVGPGQMEWFEEPLPAPPPGWVTVEVAGCGVCHTDLSYLYGGVSTAASLPLVLGHEIVGRVVDSGRTVLVPAVSPCGDCPACRRGRPTSCKQGLMPGNHHDGGFASHVQVPARWLCEVPPLSEGILWRLAAVADAVTTPYQALRRARVREGEVVVVVGAGGVGGFLVELAVGLGAHTIALDVAEPRLARARARGALAAIDPSGRDARSVRRELAMALATHDMAAEGWHVFECSGSPAGQALAFGLLTRGATLSVVGYSPEALPIKLSNLMALDAEAYGNWGCDPALYPDVLSLVLAGKVDLAGAVKSFPLSQAPDVLAAAHRHELDRRAVLVPDA